MLGWELCSRLLGEQEARTQAVIMAHGLGVCGRRTESCKELFPQIAQSRRFPGLVSDLISQYLGESSWERVALTRIQVSLVTEQIL